MEPSDSIDDKESSLPLILRLIFESFDDIKLVDGEPRRGTDSLLLLIERNDATSVLRMPVSCWRGNSSL